jgi:hypothetical protein
MSFGDIVTWICVLIALWYVPQHLLRMYAPGVMPWLRSWWQMAVEYQRDRYEQRAPAYGLRDDRVKTFQDDDRAGDDIMSRKTAQTAADGTQTQTDERVSEASQWMERLKVDRTKMALIELTVYSGWSVDEIRKVVKGDNNVMGAEIESARKRQGVEPEPAYVTPIVGRPTAARFETDPEYPYQAPAH